MEVSRTLLSKGGRPVLVCLFVCTTIRVHQCPQVSRNDMEASSSDESLTFDEHILDCLAGTSSSLFGRFGSEVGLR